MLKTHPAKIREVLNESMMSGKATETAEPLMAISNRDKATVTKMKYLDMVILLVYSSTM